MLSSWTHGGVVHWGRSRIGVGVCLRIGTGVQCLVTMQMISAHTFREALYLDFMSPTRV